MKRDASIRSEPRTARASKLRAVCLVALVAGGVMLGGFVRSRTPEKNAAGPERAGRFLAFVLLADAKLPRAEAVVAAFGRIAPPTGLPPLGVADGADGHGGDVVLLDLGSEGRLMVGLMPTPVPKGEADRYAAYSLPGAANGWKLPPHDAHLIVAWTQEARLSPVESLKRFTWLLASVADAAGAVGVYWANSGATHPTELFVASARAGDFQNLVLVWSGVSIAADAGSRDRMSLVSLGMAQLGVPDLELSVPRSCEKGDALRFLYWLLGYVARRGAPLPEGDTVGRSADERLPVKYVPSPIDGKKTVWRVELPECSAAPER